MEGPTTTSGRLGDATQPVKKSWEVLPPEDAGVPTRPHETRAPFGNHARLAVAFAIAVASDLLSVWLELFPPAEIALDLTTAGLLFLILGRQPLLLPALVAEAIPGLAIVPSWVIVVGSIALWGTVNPLKRSPSS
jgi:hypothetical protein